MAQIATFSWTNANPAIARDIDVGFTVSEILTIDITNGGSWQWVSGMVAGSYLDVDAGTITGTNGFTALAQSARYGAAISGFTAANPGVITVDDTAVFGFANGDTIEVSEIADDGTGLSLNRSYVIASFTATTITTDIDTTAYSAWVSGGTVTRVSDTNGVAIPTENFAIRGMTIGTGVVGANSASVVCIVKGENVVV
jgi:hypothetical protein